MSIYTHKPVRHPEDWVRIGPEPSGMHPLERWSNDAASRRLRSDWFSELEVQDEGGFTEDMDPYLAERIDIETGEMILAPMSYLQGLDMGIQKDYWAGFTSKHVGAQQDTALKIFANRADLKGTDLDWASLSEEKKEYINNYMGWAAGINVLKNPALHIEPMFTKWGRAPADLFLEEPHPDYDALTLYEKMWETLPTYMMRISELGGDKDWFKGARNADEWFYRANTLIQDNYIVQSMLWSDETSGTAKHLSSNVWNFVKAIANDPDMAGETAAILALTAATGGIGGVAAGAAVGFNLKRWANMARIAVRTSRANKVRRVGRWLPSNLPAHLLGATGQKGVQNFNPLRALLWANAGEGLLTGGLAETSSQMTKIDYGIMQEYDIGKIWTEAWVEALLSPGINPAIGKITSVGGEVAGLGTRLGIWVGNKTMPRRIKLPSNIREGIKVAAHILKSTETRADILEIELTATIATSRLENSLNLLEGTDLNLEGEDIVYLWNLVLPPGQDMTPAMVDIMGEVVTKQLQIQDDTGKPVTVEDTIAAIGVALGTLDPTSSTQVERVLTTARNYTTLKNKLVARQEAGESTLTLANIISEATTESPELLVNDTRVIDLAKEKIDWEEASFENKIEALDAAGLEIFGPAQETVMEQVKIVREKVEIAGTSLADWHSKHGDGKPAIVAIGDHRISLRSEHDTTVINALKELDNDVKNVTRPRYSEETLESIDAIKELRLIAKALDIKGNQSKAALRKQILEAQGNVEESLQNIKEVVENIDPSKIQDSATLEILNIARSIVHMDAIESEFIGWGTVPISTIEDLVEVNTEEGVEVLKAADAVNQALKDADLASSKAHVSVLKDAVEVKEQGDALKKEMSEEPANQIEQELNEDEENVKQLLNEEESTEKRSSFQESIEKLQGAAQVIQLSNDETVYVNRNDPSQQFTRVTDVIASAPEMTQAVKNGATVGTNLDTIARDVLSGDKKGTPLKETPAEPVEKLTKELKNKKELVEMKENHSPGGLIANIDSALRQGLITDLQAKMLRTWAEDVSKGKRTLFDFNMYIQTNINPEAIITESPIRRWLSDAHDLSKAGVEFNNRLTGEVAPVYITGEVKPYAEYVNDDGTPYIESEEEFNNYVKQLNELKSEIEGAGKRILAKNIVVHSDELGIAGTVDLLVVDDANKTVEIIDIKTKKTLDYLTSTKFGMSDNEKWTKQLSLYRILLKNQYGIDANKVTVLPVLVDYQINTPQNFTPIANLQSPISINPSKIVTTITGDKISSTVSKSIQNKKESVDTRLSNLENKYGIRTKGIFTGKEKGATTPKRVSKLNKKIQQKRNKNIHASHKLAKKYEKRAKDLQVTTQKSSTSKNQVEAQNAIATVRNRVGNYVTIQDFTELRQVQDDKKQAIKNADLVWDSWWKDPDHTTANLGTLQELIRNTGLINRIVAKYGKDRAYTFDELEPYFKKYKQKLTDELGKLRVRNIMLSHGEIRSLNEFITNSDKTLVTDIDSSYRPKLRITKEERLKKIADGEFDPVNISNLSTLSTQLRKYANRLDFIEKRTSIITEDRLISYSLLKDSLPSRIRWLNIQETFEEAGRDPNNNVFPFLDIEDSVFNIDLVITQILHLLTKTTETTRVVMQDTANRVLADLKNPIDPNSEYSIYRAHGIATMLLEASSKLDIEEFGTNKKIHGNGFKKKRGDTITYVSEHTFLEDTYEAAMQRYNQLSGRIQERIRLEIGLPNPDSAGNIQAADLNKKLNSYFAIRNMTIADMGNGNRGYRTSQDLGGDIIDRVAGMVPGIAYKRVSRRALEDDTFSIEEQAKLVSTEFEEVSGESTILLVPITGDMTSFAPRRDHELLRVIEDEVTRNRQRFALSIPITEEMIVEWNKGKSTRKAAEINYTGRFPPTRTVPYISNKTFLAPLLTHSEHRDAMYEILLDTPIILAKFIHDGVLSGQSYLGQYDRETKRHSTKLTTGNPTAVPLSNLGWIITLLRILPELRTREFDTDFLSLMMNQGLELEKAAKTPSEALSTYNYEDQKFQGLHLFTLLSHTQEELIKFAQELADESKWVVDLEDRYITSGTFIAQVALNSDNNMSDTHLDKNILNKFVTLYNKAGLESGRTEEELVTDLDNLEDTSKFEAIRDFFKVGPLRTLYGGGLPAWRNYWLSDKGRAVLDELNKNFDADITTDDMVVFGNTLFKIFVYENTNLMKSSMGFTTKKVKAVLEKYRITGVSEQAKHIKKAKDPAHKQELKRLEKELSKRLGKEEEVPQGVATQLQVYNQILASIRDHGDRRGNTEESAKYFKGIVDEYLAFEKKVRDGTPDKKGKEFFTEDEYQEAQRIVGGVHSRNMAWKEVEYLRMLNTAHKVASGINVDHLKIQEEIMGLRMYEEDLMNMENLALYHTFAPSASSGRPTPVVVDLMNIHEHNTDASKVATEDWDEPSLEVLRKLEEEEGLPRMVAIAQMLREHKAPFGMWRMQHNSLQATKKDFGPLDEFGDFINKKDKVAWRKASELEVDKLIMRDEMLHASTFGPLDVPGYGQDIVIGDKVIEIFSEENGQEMVDTIVKRWRERTEQEDAAYQKFIDHIDKLDFFSLDPKKSKEEREAAKEYLRRINKWHGIEIDQLTHLNLPSTQGLMRHLREYAENPTRRTEAGKIPLGIRTANPSGVAAFRPLIARMPWGNVGNLELRKQYYKEQIETLENNISPALTIEGKIAETIDDVLPENMRQDVSLYGDSKIYYFEVGEDFQNIMDPRRVPSEKTARILREVLEPFALELGFDLEHIKQNGEEYADLYHLHAMEELLGYAPSSVSSPNEQFGWSYINDLIRTVTKADRGEELLHNIRYSRMKLSQLVLDIHKVPSSVIDRVESTLSLMGRGTSVGAKATKEGTTYEDALRGDKMFGELTRLGDILQFGITTEENVELIFVDKDGVAIRHRESGIVDKVTKEPSLFTQSYDALLLWYALSDQTDFDTYLKERNKEMWKVLQSGLYTEFSNRYSMRELHEVVSDFIDTIDIKSLSNEVILLNAKYDSKRKKIEFKERNESITVYRNPLETGQVQTPRLGKGPNVYVQLTPAALFAALQNNKNFHFIEAGEQAYRQGVDFNPTKESTQSARLQQDLTFNLRDARVAAIVLQEALSILAGERKGELDIFDESREVKGIRAKFIDSRSYLNKGYDIALTPGGKTLELPLWKVSFILPIIKLMTRLNHYGLTALNEKIEALVEPNMEQTRNILGFMLRHPKITKNQLAAVLPDTKGIDTAYSLANDLLKDINKTLQWREFSPSVAHLHSNNHPQGSWRSQASPIALITRAWVENSDVMRKLSSTAAQNTVKQGEVFTEHLLPHVREQWASLRKDWLKQRDETGKLMNEELVKFYDDHIETLTLQALVDAINTYDESALIDTDTSSVLMQADSDSKYLPPPSLTPAEVKKFSNENTLLNEFKGKKEIIANLHRLLIQIPNLPITAEHQNILRATLGWWAKTQPGFLDDLNFSVQSLKGPRIAFAEKWGEMGEIRVTREDLYTSGKQAAKLANQLLLEGVSREKIESMPEFTDPNWESSDKVVELDIESSLIEDGRKITAIVISDSKDPTKFTYKAAETIDGLSKKQAAEILEILDKKQQEGYKLFAHNGLHFDLPLVGKIAGNEQLAKQIALRSFDPLAILETNTEGDPRFKLEALTLAILDEGKEGEKGGAWSYLLWLRSLNLKIIDEHLKTDKGKDLPFEWKEEANKIEAEDAAELLQTYTEKDGALTLELGQAFIRRKGEEIKGVLYNTEKKKDLVANIILESKAAWQLLEGEFALPRSILEEFTFSTTLAEAGKFDTAGYHVVVDADKIANSDTMSAVEIIFHELMEIGQLKYMSEDSVSYLNLVREIQKPENRALIKEMIIKLDGGRPNVNTAAKIEYILGPEASSNEAIAQLGAYMLGSRVLSNTDKTSVELDKKIENSSMYASLKDFVGGIMQFVSTQFKKITNIFAAYRSSHPLAYDELMVMMDEVFGLDSSKLPLKDVSNLPSGPRFMQDFKTFQSKPASELPGDEKPISDDEYLQLVLQKNELLMKIDVMNKGQAPVSHKLQNDLTEILVQLRNHGYQTESSGSYSTDNVDRGGYNALAMTRETLVTTNTLLDENKTNLSVGNKKLTVIAARSLIKDFERGGKKDRDIIGALATRVLDNLIKHLDGRLAEGIGGMVRLNVPRGIVDLAKKAVTGWSGSDRTWNSPFLLLEILSNFVVDGATLTSGSVNPDLEIGTVSVGKARINAADFEGSINEQVNAVLDAIDDSGLYKNSSKDEEAQGLLDLQLVMAAVAIVGLDPESVKSLTNNRIDFADYNKKTQEEIYKLKEDWQWINKELIPLSMGVKRAVFASDIELLPYKLAEAGTPKTNSLLIPLQQGMRNRINGNTEDICMPVLYAAQLLPSTSRLLSSESISDVPFIDTGESLLSDLKHIRDNYPEYYKKILKQAYKEDVSTRTLETFTNESRIDTMHPEVFRAWVRYVGKQLETFNSRRGSPKWNDLLKDLPATEIAKIKNAYNMVKDNEFSSSIQKNRLNALLKTDWGLEGDISTPWLNRKLLGKNREWNNIVSFLASQIIGNIGHRPFFVQDDTWIPKVSELLSDEKAVSALELDPAKLARGISRTIGHTATEVAMFAEVTGTDLNFNEMLDLFSYATDPSLNLTDERGRLLTEEEKIAIHTSVDKTLRQKYYTLRGVVDKLATADDLTAAALAKDSMWAIKIAYGTNLATATAMVEGTLAALFLGVGPTPFRAVLFPIFSYLKPYLGNKKKLLSISRSMYYMHQMRTGRLNEHEDSSSVLSDLSDPTGENLYTQTGLESSGTALTGLSTDKIGSAGQQRKTLNIIRGWLGKRGEGTVEHAMYVAAEIKSGIDILTRVELVEHMQNTKNGLSAWEELAILLKETDIKALIKETETAKGLTTSQNVWKKLTKQARWGKDWRLAQFLARNGLMTPESVKLLKEMDAGSREMFDHTEEYFDMYLMRQWFMNIDQSTSKNKERFHAYYKVWKGLRQVVQERINTIMVNPNVLDMNTASEGIIHMLSQYRSYPMLFTGQRIIRDSSVLSPQLWLIKTLVNTILDMTYTTVIMIAGGYKWEDMREDLSSPGGVLEFLGMLASRLPFFGFWGSALFEVIQILKYGRGEFVSPIGMTGVIKLLRSITGAIEGGFKQAIPGGKGWDDSDWKQLINSMRMVKKLGEAPVRIALHTATREGRTRGSFKRGGTGKMFSTYSSDYSKTQNALVVKMLEEFAPHLFEGPNFWMEEQAIQEAVGYLPDIPQEEPEAGLEVQPEMQPEVAPEPRTTGVPEIPSGGYIPAPEGI